MANNKRVAHLLQNFHLSQLLPLIVAVFHLIGVDIVPDVSEGTRRCIRLLKTFHLPIRACEVNKNNNRTLHYSSPSKLLRLPTYPPNSYHPVALSMAPSKKPSPEGPPTTYFWSRTDRSSPSSFPHASHDFNTLSVYSISANAFSSSPSPVIGSFHQLSSLSSEDISSAYDAILSDVDFINAPMPLIHSFTQDYDRIGVLFEYKDDYFVAIKDVPEHVTDSSMGVNRGFMEKEHVGAHLVAEWDSLPKERVGSCVIASGTDGWWHVKSKMMGDVRQEVAWKVKIIHREMKGRTEQEEGFKERLRDEVSVVVDRAYRKMDWEERKGRKGEEAEMGEWLDWDARGKDDGEENGGEEDDMQVDDTVQEENTMPAERIGEEEDAGEKLATRVSGDAMEE